MKPYHPLGLYSSKHITLETGQTLGTNCLHLDLWPAHPELHRVQARCWACSKPTTLWEQNNFTSKQKQHPGAWKRTAFSESHYLHSKHTTSFGWKFPFTALCAKHTARNAHLGSYSHIQPPGIIQRPLFKHISELLPDDPNIPVKRGVGESPGWA